MTTNHSPADLKSERHCTRCKGTGMVHSQWNKDNGYEGPEGKKCSSCTGTGVFPGLDVKAIADALFTTRGKTRKFRKSYTSTKGFSDTFQARVYYVWRLARFHGGADVTMPMTADLLVRADPFKKELDLIAEHVAKLVFGTDMAGAVRWGTALGILKEAPAGLPSSAYESGPVADEFKPAFEAMELK